MTAGKTGADRRQPTVIRTWLAHLVRGASPPWPFGRDQDLSHLLASAEEEGVVALVHDRLRDPERAAAVPAELLAQFGRAAHQKAAESLMRESACRRILARTERAGLPVLLLKGSALAYWAYALPYLRDCGDIDLLLRTREDADRVVEMLGADGLRPRDPALPGDLVSFELTCVRDGRDAPPLEIDLHWRLSGAPIFAYRFEFEELATTSIALPRIASSARGLSPVHAYLHACMHRVQTLAWSGSDTLKWLFDLDAVGRRLTAQQWQQLATVACHRGLAGVCIDAIDAAAPLFGNRVPDAIRAELDRGTVKDIIAVSRVRSWTYVQWKTLLAFPTNGQRLRWLRQRVLPDRDYLRLRYGDRGWVPTLATRLKDGLRRLAR